MLAAIHARAAEYERHDRKILRLAAFLGRYGKQDVRSSLKLPITDFLALVEEVAQLLKEEAKKGPSIHDD